MLLLQVLVSPRAAFERLREKGGWVPALIIIVLLSGLTVYLQWPLIEREMEIALEMSGQEPLDAETKAVIGAVAKFSAWAGGMLTPVFTMFFAGLLLYFLNLILRGEAGYMQLAKAALYSYAPGVLGGLLQSGLAAALGAKSIRDVTITGGALFEEKTGLAYALAESLIDPFGWWGLALMTIGASVMMRKPAKQAAYWIAGAWLLVRLGFALAAMMPGAGGFGTQ